MGDFVFSIKHLCTCTGMSKVRTLTIMGHCFSPFLVRKTNLYKTLYKVLCLP